MAHRGAVSLAGFALVASRQWDGDRSYEIIGFTLMGMGLPLVTTLTDRIFRTWR